MGPSSLPFVSKSATFVFVPPMSPARIIGNPSFYGWKNNQAGEGFRQICSGAYRFDQLTPLGHCFLVDCVAAEKSKLAAQAISVTARLAAEHSADRMCGADAGLGLKLCSIGA